MLQFNAKCLNGQFVLVVPVSNLNSHKIFFCKHELYQGTLTEGKKAQYSGPPCTNKFRSAAFDIAKISYFYMKL